MLCINESLRVCADHGIVAGINPYHYSPWGYGAYGINKNVLNVFPMDWFAKETGAKCVHLDVNSYMWYIKNV
jgi:hypothetical protein